MSICVTIMASGHGTAPSTTQRPLVPPCAAPPSLPPSPGGSQPARHHQGAFRECHTAGIQLCGASETGLPSWQDAFEGRQAAESPRSVLVTHLALYSLLQKPARIINKNKQ